MTISFKVLKAPHDMTKQTSREFHLIRKYYSEEEVVDVFKNSGFFLNFMKFPPIKNTVLCFWVRILPTEVVFYCFHSSEIQAFWGATEKVINYLSHNPHPGTNRPIFSLIERIKHGEKNFAEDQFNRACKEAAPKVHLILESLAKEFRKFSNTECLVKTILKELCYDFPRNMDRDEQLRVLHSVLENSNWKSLLILPPEPACEVLGKEISNSLPEFEDGYPQPGWV